MEDESKPKVEITEEAKSKMSALEYDIKNRGENSYYYAHKGRFEDKNTDPNAKTISGPGIITGGDPVLLKTEKKVVEQVKVPKTISNYQFYDDDKFAVVKIDLPKDAEEVTEDSIESNFQKRSFNLKIKVPNGEHYVFKVTKLYMAIDPENINDLYLSIPTKNGAYNKDGVYEIWKYTINDAGEVAGSTQITSNSPKNNARPYVIPGTKNSPLRLVWMQGDYYYWIVRQGYPLGYPTAIHSNYAWPEEVSDISSSVVNCTCLKANQTLNVALAMNSSKYEGDILRSDDGNFVYSLNGNTQYPELTVNGTTYKSQNRLLTSDE